MFSVRSALDGSQARRSRGVTALIVLVSLFLLAQPFPPSARADYVGFVVDTDTVEIFGGGWMPGSTMTISIDEILTPGSPDIVRSVSVDMSGSFSASFANEYFPIPGDVITVATGGFTSTYRVQPFDVMNSDEAADVVTGTGEPGARVSAQVVGVSNSNLLGYVDADGHWSFDYAGFVDLKAGTIVRLREYGEVWNARQTVVTLPVPEDFDGDMVRNMDDNCPWTPNVTQYDGDGDGTGTVCDEVDRVWGANRYGTAAAVSQMAFDRADTVFIALGTNFPDALVAAAAGGYLDAPVLLTGSDSLPAETVAELVRLAPNNAYVVGGTAVIAPSVEQQLHAYVPRVMRLAGANRYETAADVATKVFHAATVAFVALGTNFPDALVAASPAGMIGAPVLLTAHGHLPETTSDVLAGMHPTKIYVVGGTAAISETVVRELSAYGPVERLAGANRYETAAAVGDRFFGKYNAVLLAYGRNFPDALVAAAAGGHLGAPVLLVERDSVPSATSAAIGRLESQSHWLVGGTAVIGPDVFNAFC